LTDRLMGIETEYTLAAFGLGTGPGSQERAAMALIDRARKTLVNLPGAGSGLFLANGARFYLDTGGHPELTTPECSDPREVVRYVQAGDLILSRLADGLSREGNLGQVFLSRSNFDYNTGTSWACHESYLHRTQPVLFVRHLVPHLVSRIVYTGSGGFDGHTDHLAYLLSPRVKVLTEVHSECTTNGRGILNTRDESLSSAGYKRLHLICGEGCCSQRVTFLKVGTTAIVVALIEAGLIPGNSVELQDPVGAMQVFTRDPMCRATAPTRNGRQLSALMIQRYYLELAERHTGHEILPPWTAEVCRAWRGVLDRLEMGAPDSVALELDWAIKLSVLRNHARRHGSSWPDTPQGQAKLQDKELRQQLLEIDTRFSQITNPGGIFAALDRAGTLRHQVDGVGDVESALDIPPGHNRAHVRSHWIHQLAKNNGRYRCDWSGIWDTEQGRLLDLSDPFCRQADWTTGSALAEFMGHGMFRMPEPDVEHVAALYRQGCYSAARVDLDSLAEVVQHCSPGWQVRYWRFSAWVNTRRGFLDGFELLARTPERAADINGLYDHLSVARFQGLAVPVDRTREWINRCETVVPGDTMGAAYLEHKAAYLLRCHQVEHALAVLLEAQQLPESQAHILGRIRALLGEAYRRMHHPDKAREWLAQAHRIQRAGHIRGDVADYTCFVLAKLEPEVGRARQRLRQAQKIQESLGNHVGLIRTLLLRARFSNNPAEIQELHHRINSLAAPLPGVVQCPMYRHIMENWDRWVGDPQDTDKTGDRFWGLTV